MAAKKKEEVIKPVTKLKDLPRHSDGTLMRRFWANGTEYTILTADDIVSGQRYVRYSEACMIAATGLDLQNFINILNETEELIYEIDENDKSTRTAPILKLRSIREAIIRKNQSQYDDMQFMCTFFIVRADEDLRYFNQGLAQEKLHDWNEEGYRVHDFFHLGTDSIVGYHSVSKKVRAEKLRISDGIDTLMGVQGRTDK